MRFFKAIRYTFLILFATLAMSGAMSGLASAKQDIRTNQFSSIYWGTSFLAHKGNGVWHEVVESGRRIAFSFLETARTEKTITLQDAGRNVFLRINMIHGWVEIWNANTNRYQNLYKIEGVYDQAGNQTKLASSQNSSTSQFVRPDLSKPWSSNYGTIYWEHYIWDNPYNAMRGELKKDPSGRYYYSGKWRAYGEEGELFFQFSPDGRSFAGRFRSYTGNGDWQPWNGSK